MYKFTNGIVVFDEKTRDDFIKAGYKLVATGGIVDDKTIINNCNETILPKELIQDLEKQLDEVLDENTSNDGTIKEKSRRSKKISK